MEFGLLFIFIYGAIKLYIFLGSTKTKLGTFGTVRVHPRGDKTFYYIKLYNRKNQVRYKVGITKYDVKKRYINTHTGYHEGKDYEIIYEKRLLNAEEVEAKIKQRYKSSYDYLLGTAGTEIFDVDILGLDHNAKIADKKEMMSILTEGSGRININYPIAISSINRLLKYSKEHGNIYFDNKRDYDNFLAYIKKTYVDSLTKQNDAHYIFSSNDGAEFRLLSKEGVGQFYMMQSRSGK